MNSSSGAILDVLNPILFCAVVAIVAIMIWQGGKELWAFIVKVRALDQLEAPATEKSIEGDRPSPYPGKFVDNLGRR